MCEREREREEGRERGREREGGRERDHVCERERACVCAFVCVFSNLSIFDDEQLDQRISFPKGLVQKNISQMDARFVGKIFAGVGVQFTKKKARKS